MGKVTVKPKAHQYISPVHVELIEAFDQHWYRKIDARTGEIIADIPSVTTILGAAPKPWLLKWYGDLGWDGAKKARRDAQDRGSRVHWAINKIVTGGGVIYVPPPQKLQRLSPDEIQQISVEHAGNVATLQRDDECCQVGRFIEWLIEVKPVPIAAEEMVISTKQDCAGTLDLGFRIPTGEYQIAGERKMKVLGGFYIIDIKTGAKSDDHILQLAAYCKLWEEMHPDTPVAGAMVIYTNAATQKGIAGLNTVQFTLPELDEAWLEFKDVQRVWLRRNKNKRPEILHFSPYMSWEWAKQNRAYVSNLREAIR